MTTAFITHKIFLKHQMGDDHPECPERLSNLCDRLLISHLGAFLNWIDEPPPAEIAQIARAHSMEYLNYLLKAAPERGVVIIDDDTTMNEFSLDAACYAAGAGIHAVDLLMNGEIDNAFCAVRPPGHHATRQQAMGFCFFNNIAIAGFHAIDKYNINRVAVFDFDVHHGNGTEDILAGDKRFLMLSTFEHPLYPYSGDKPLGNNMVNVPIPRYGKAGHLYSAVEKWEEALEKFRPELILVSAGYDAHAEDEMSSTRWTDKEYAWLSRKLTSYANKYANGKIIVMLEGGYNINALARNAIEFISVLME